MSSYLSFYVVPKKEKENCYWDSSEADTNKIIKLSEGVPLFLMSYCRNSNIYQAFNDALNPPYAGNEEKYKEITSEDTKRVVEYFESKVNITKQRLEIDYKILKEGGYSPELWEDIQSMEELLKEEEESLDELKFLQYLIGEIISYSDFEKVLINID